MVQTREIKAFMKRRNITQAELATAIRINISTLNKKINNVSGEKLTLKEAQEIADVLEIPDFERTNIFFAKSVAYEQHAGNK